MVCVSEPTFPGCVIRVKPIALFKMWDDKGEDDKIVCVPLNDPGWNHAETLEDIPRAAPARDHPLLLDLQAARGQESGRGGMALARGGARRDRRMQSACRSRSTAKLDRLPRRISSPPAQRSRAAGSGSRRNPTSTRRFASAGSRTRRLHRRAGRHAAPDLRDLHRGRALRRDQRQRPDRLRLRGRRPRPRVRPLRADHHPRRGERRALQSRGDARGGDPAADRPGRRGRLHPRPALRRRPRRAAGQGASARRGPRRHYGAATISPLLAGTFAGALVEGIGTFLLVLAVCAVAFNPRARRSGRRSRSASRSASTS